MSSRRLISLKSCVLFLACTFVFSACGPNAVEIPGIDELTKEIRSQRLAGRQFQSTTPLTVDSQVEGLSAAMAPLRDVLTELGTSQSELSARQSSLTKEMKNWTQLLVQSMPSQQGGEAMQLQQRLANLEALIAKQDARHQKVEGMIASALDHTADQLEAFLRRVGADPASFDSAENAPTEVAVKSTPTQAGQPPAPVEVAPSSAEDGSERGQVRPISSAPDALQPPANGPKGNGPKGNGAKGSASFMWWSLAGLAVVGGFVLLRRKQQANPLAIAPEMQVRTPPVRRSRKPQSPPPTVAEEPEVEDLWATAALLGEAIGRLKHVEDPTHPNEEGHKNAAGAEGLQERGNGTSNHGSNPGTPIVIEDEDKLPFVAPQNGVQPVSPTAETDDFNARPADLGVAHLLDLPGSIKPEKMPTPTEPSPPVSVRVAGPLFANDQGELGPPVGGAPSECEPMTCRLPVAPTQKTEGRVRSLLAADPRVLRSPAPKVRKLKGHLEVSFSVLPGLPDGERSLLEQQLRDTVA